ncbi:voltage-dependent anion channel [Calycina marina]|uniref:Voltage-dependent anion channel n=1 Tax=Calycina marina TaxID=1763456 RepID=A0A9P7Z4T0_9HELO|nr:voltage-dependent anion channel [Calycina marina]
MAPSNATLFSYNDQAFPLHRYHTGLSEGQASQVQFAEVSKNQDLPFQERIHHFTWAWFSTSMSAGGLALLLAHTPHRFPGLTEIATSLFVLSLVLFSTFCVCIATRFILFRGTFRASVLHHTESLFFPTFWISIANITSNIAEYGAPKSGPWVDDVLRIVFWTYVGSTFLVAVGQYFFLFTGKPLTLQSFTPGWTLPIFPVMLSGTLAGAIAPTQATHQALPILLAGLTFQGLGLMIAVFFYSIYLGRLMSNGLPAPNKRPGMFIAVGPPSFTALALLSMSEALASLTPPPTINHFTADPLLLPAIIRAIALVAAIFLWATALWFFSISLVSVIGGFYTGGMRFHLTWWAMTFPNIGFTIATISIGKTLGSEGILWVSSGMTIVIVATWLFIAFSQVRGVWQKDILWPGKDEDQ